MFPSFPWTSTRLSYFPSRFNQNSLLRFTSFFPLRFHFRSELIWPLEIVPSSSLNSSSTLSLLVSNLVNINFFCKFRFLNLVFVNWVIRTFWNSMLFPVNNEKMYGENMRFIFCFDLSTFHNIPFIVMTLSNAALALWTRMGRGGEIVSDSVFWSHPRSFLHFCPKTSIFHSLAIHSVRDYISENSIHVQTSELFSFKFSPNSKGDDILLPDICKLVINLEDKAVICGVLRYSRQFASSILRRWKKDSLCGLILKSCIWQYFKGLSVHHLTRLKSLPLFLPVSSSIFPPKECHFSPFSFTASFHFFISIDQRRLFPSTEMQRVEKGRQLIFLRKHDSRRQAKIPVERNFGHEKGREFIWKTSPTNQMLSASPHHHTCNLGI